MARISLFEVLKRQNKLQTAIDEIKKFDNDAGKGMEWLCNFVKCSAPTAKKLYGELKEFITTDEPESKPTQPVQTEHIKITKADLEEVKKNNKKQLWAVCTKPLRGVYLRPNDKGDGEEYKHVSLYLGCVHADTEKEAVDLAKQKYDALPVLENESFFAFKVCS